MKKVVQSLFLAVVAHLFISDGIAQTKGWLCEPCINFASAREQAIQYAPALQCGDRAGGLLDPDSGSECEVPPPKQVILGHPASKTVYVFDVGWTQAAGFWEPVADSSSLPPAEHALAVETLFFLADWRRFLSDVHRQWAEEQGFSDGDVSAYTYSKFKPGLMTGGGNDCPSNTALTTLLDKGALDALESELRDEAEQRLREYVENDGVVESSRISLGPPQANMTFEVSDSGGRIPTAVARYYLQRETTLIDNARQHDRLVWSVEASGHTESAFGIDLNAVYADLSLDLGKSTVLGMQADKVLGPSDNFWEQPPEITDPCAIDALASAQEGIPGGEWRDRDSGAVVDFSGASEPGGVATPGAGSGSDRMCLFDFYTGDVYQFSASLPCDAVKDKNAIQD